MTTNFAHTRNRLLSLQSQIAAKLSRYSAIASTPGPVASEDEEGTSRQIEKLLGEMREEITSMDRLAESDESISTSKLQQLARHKVNLNQFRVDFERISSTIQEERNRLNLLSDVRTELKDRSDRARREGPADTQNYMLDERMRIDQEHGVVDKLLGQVFQTRDEILRQRGTFRSMGVRLQQSLGTMPGINVLMGKINTRKKRNALVLSTVIVFCIIALWFLY